MKKYRLRKNDKCIIKLAKYAEENYYDDPELKHGITMSRLEIKSYNHTYKKLWSERQKKDKTTKSQVKEVRK